MTCLNGCSVRGTAPLTSFFPAQSRPHEYRVIERRANTIVVNAEVGLRKRFSQWASQQWRGRAGSFARLHDIRQNARNNRRELDSAETMRAVQNRKTMERYNHESFGDNPENWTTWGTNIGFLKNGKDADGNQILGTPRGVQFGKLHKCERRENITSDLTLAADNCYYISAGVRVAASHHALWFEAGVQISLYKNNLAVDGVLGPKEKRGTPVVFPDFCH